MLNENELKALVEATALHYDHDIAVTGEFLVTFETALGGEQVYPEEVATRFAAYALPEGGFSPHALYDRLPDAAKIDVADHLIRDKGHGGIYDPRPTFIEKVAERADEALRNTNGVVTIREWAGVKGT